MGWIKNSPPIFIQVYFIDVIMFPNVLPVLFMVVTYGGCNQFSLTYRQYYL